MNKPIDILLAELDDFIKDVSVFIDKNGGSIKTEKIYDVKKALEQLYVVNPKKEYIAFELDDQGYIRALNKLDAIVETQPIPEDILRGYYKVNKNKIVFDQERQNQLWGE